MATEEDLKLTYFHGHSEATATHGKVSSETNLKTSRATPTQRKNEQKPSSKQVREDKTQSHHKPHILHGGPHEMLPAKIM